MKNLSTLLLAAAVTLCLCACEKENEAPAPIVGTWEFVSQTIDVSADDAEVAAKLINHYDDNVFESFPYRFRNDGTFENKAGIEGWFSDCGGGSYSCTGDNLTVTTEAFPTGVIEKFPAYYRYALAPDGKTMTWEEDLLVPVLAAQSTDIHIEIVLPETGEAVSLDGVHSVKRIITLKRK